MGIGISVFLIAAGALMTFAVEVDSSDGFNINNAGVILMVVGLIGLLMTAIIWGPGLAAPSSRTTPAGGSPRSPAKSSDPRRPCTPADSSGADGCRGGRGSSPWSWPCGWQGSGQPRLRGPHRPDARARTADPASTVANRAFGWLLPTSACLELALGDRALPRGGASAARTDDLLDLDTTRIRLESLVDLIDDATDPTAPGYLGRPDSWVGEHVAGPGARRGPLPTRSGGSCRRDAPDPSTGWSGPRPRRDCDAMADDGAPLAVVRGRGPGRVAVTEVDERSRRRRAFESPRSFARICVQMAAALAIVGVAGLVDPIFVLPLAGLVLALAAIVWLAGSDHLDDPDESAPPEQMPVEHTFRLPASVGAEQVWLVGELNDWSRTAHPMRREGEWFTLTLELEPRRSYRYRYLLDGERWENDWDADEYVPNEFGTDDSVVRT